MYTKNFLGMNASASESEVIPKTHMWERLCNDV